MSSKINSKEIIDKLQPLVATTTRYLGLIFFVFFMSIYGFLMLRINSLAGSKVSDSDITERLKTVQRPRIDEKAAAKIEQLEDQNIQVKTLFNKARQNPFSE